jgi:Large polyvalent protein-associated domain 7
MDADKSPARQTAPAQGGTVEPANRAQVAIERFQAPKEVTGERFEMRDPFAEVTYRAQSFTDMVAKADQLGSTRIVAVAEDGKRTPIQKVDGQWQRGQQRPAPPVRLLDEGPTRDDAPSPKNLVQLPTTLRPPAQPERADAPRTETVDLKAERASRTAQLVAGLMDRYIVKRAPVTVGDMTVGRTEYRFRGDSTRVAFTESTFRLATDTNSPSVARSMVDVAEARNWKALRVSGNEDFRRMVWVEASVRGVKTLGYEPNAGDLEVLKREREARLVNRIEPAPEAGRGAATTPAEKASARGGGGRKAVLVAIEALLVAKGVPEKQREAVMAAATEKLAQRIRDGQAPRVKVYDKSAPSQRPVTVPTPEIQRTREQSAPTPSR